MLIDETPSLRELAGNPAYSADLIAHFAAIGDATAAHEAMSRFTEAVTRTGADAGVFNSVVQDDATRASFRSLLACDPAWAADYAREQRHAVDPWLRHATSTTEPIRSRDLALKDPGEQEFVEAAARHGFRSYLLAPAPSCLGQSRVGVLCLGSHRADFFDDDAAYPVLRVLARAMAMELHRWLARSIRQELLLKSRLTAADLDLLRAEAAGQSSKVIAARLALEPKTVDCRFQRISAKLEAPNRRAAVRIARLYGLL